MIFVNHVAVSSWPPDLSRLVILTIPYSLSATLSLSVQSHAFLVSADCGMANDVLQALHPGPPAKPRIVRPDGLVGLSREHIRIALSSESPALPYTINSYIMTLNRRMFSSGTVSTTVCPPYHGSIRELGQLTRPRRLDSQPSLPNITMITSTSSSKGRTAVRDKHGSKTPLPTTSPSVSPSTLPTSRDRHRRTSSDPRPTR